MELAFGILFFFGGLDLFLVSNLALFTIRSKTSYLVNRCEYMYYKRMLVFSFMLIMIGFYNLINFI